LGRGSTGRPLESGVAEIEALTRGVDSTGELRVERANGLTTSVHLGDSVIWLEA